MRRVFTNFVAKQSKQPKTQRNLLATLLAKVLHDTAHQKLPRKQGPIGILPLYTSAGGRKYLNMSERRRFETAARTMPSTVRVFCLVLMWSGCRISEALAVTPMAIDREAGTIALVTLKRRKLCVRAVPLPAHLIAGLNSVFDLSNCTEDDASANSRLCGAAAPLDAT